MRKYINISDVLWFQEGPGVRNTQYTTDGVKLLNVANLINGNVDTTNTNRYISKEEAYGKYKHFLADEGDLVIASSGIKVEYFDKKMGLIRREQLPLCMNTSTIRFKVTDQKRLSIRYFMYYLKSAHFKEQLSQQITGSAQLNFGPSHLKKMVFPLIEMEEQAKIIDKLDTLHDIEYKMRTELKLYDQLTSSLFIEMFGDPISNPKEWKKKKCKNILTKIGSGATPQGGSESYKEEGISLIRSMNVHNGRFESKDLAYIDEKQAQKLDNVNIKENDVLINITGASVARCCIVPSDVIPARVNQHVSVLRCSDVVNSIFLCYQIINDSYQNLLKKIGTSGGATREAITKKQIEDLEVILPPLELQNKFANFVRGTDKSKYSSFSHLSA